MSGKPRVKKGIESLRAQIALHKEKLRAAQERGDIGLVAYYEKELRHFEEVIERLARKFAPKKRRPRAARFK